MPSSIHFHPNSSFASIFVAPLIRAEKQIGYKTLLVVDKARYEYTEQIRISFNLTLNNLISLPFSFVKIFLLIFKTKPDLIISHNTRSSFLPLICAKLLGIKKVIYFNHGVPHLGYRGLMSWILKLIEITNCLLATEIITVSLDMKNELRKLTSKKVSLINNGSASGLNLNNYSRTHYKTPKFRELLNIKADDFVCIYIGRPEKRKGYGFLVQLWCERFSNNQNYKLILCGSDYKDLSKESKNLPDNIIALGFIHNIPEVLANSDCLLLPSLHEGLSYATLEALASECVVVANNIPGIRCLIKDGINGFLINGNQKDEYEAKIRQIKDLIGTKVHKTIVLQGLITASNYSQEKFIADYTKYLSNSMRS